MYYLFLTNNCQLCRIYYFLKSVLLTCIVHLLSRLLNFFPYCVRILELKLCIYPYIIQAQEKQKFRIIHIIMSAHMFGLGLCPQTEIEQMNAQMDLCKRQHKATNSIIMFATCNHQLWMLCSTCAGTMTSCPVCHTRHWGFSVFLKERY